MEINLCSSLEERLLLAPLRHGLTFGHSSASETTVPVQRSRGATWVAVLRAVQRDVGAGVAGELGNSTTSTPTSMSMVAPGFWSGARLGWPAVVFGSLAGDGAGDITRVTLQFTKTILVVVAVVVVDNINMHQSNPYQMAIYTAGHQGRRRFA
ncbi:hypothetical protein I7I51_02720 [Histoplasma capsulatum]|uniref:Uncharacterized protein n=1 Tax=Ajellomyces capsulatus TaxID=5037 RepID=A0A8A1MPF9_AJECA|nr:hypothetical protein I7I51_02720 [Histoplasma capsulatum]